MTSRPDLHAMARSLMIDNGFQPDVPPEATAELASVTSAPPPAAATGDIRDLRHLLWSSIDNDTSRDLDQVEVAEAEAGGVRVRVGIADVDAFVKAGQPLDRYAGSETTTVYAGIENFPMLPEALSTGATSLLETGDRLSLVVEFLVAKDGAVSAGAVSRALIRNRAQLTYDAVGAWLEGRAAPPPKVAASTELQAQLQLQHSVASALCAARHQHGALDIDTIETHPVVMNDQVVDVVRQQKNAATELIEDFMIAANGVVARLFESNGRASIRRVVRTPKRWDRIVALAAAQGGHLPDQPDAKALNDFLSSRKAADPDHFADLSLSVIKLMGPGEYVLERPGDAPTGHFGLAVQDYTHSTAPNRRYADLVSQRLLKSMLSKAPSPYGDDALAAIADRCTKMEDAARKVERAMSKRISAVAMTRRIGQTFDAIVTGVTPHGTFVRALDPHVEGLLASGAQGVDVGDRLRVKLVHTDPTRGFIDFART